MVRDNGPPKEAPGRVSVADDWSGSVSRVLQLLHQALAIEYGFIIDHTRIADLIGDEGVRARMSALGVSSAKHAQAVAGLIQEMGGGEKGTYVEPFPEGAALGRILQIQAEKEKLARWIYRTCAELASTGEMRCRMAEMAAVEEGHLRVVEDVIAAVAGSAGAAARSA